MAPWSYILTEVMPRAIRTTGFSLAYSLATALFGGFTPLVSTWLIHQTGDKAAPALWLSAAALVGLAGAMGLRRVSGKSQSEDAPFS